MAEKGPVKLWNQAVKAVKGDSAELVESFTAEMTLVAEGLVEDQARLRREVEDLIRAKERDGQSLRSELEALENELKEHEKATDKRLDELARRLDAASKPSKSKGKEAPKWLDKLLLLAGIVCGSWVLVTIINLFH